MSRNKQKLELTWIGKEERPRLEPRILLEDKNISYHAEHRMSEKDIFDNILIKGDNLLALKALEQEFSGKIKCICIDPPYNTGSAFNHYDDGIEHSLWLSLIRDRLEMLRKLLSDDGSIWITLDDNEVHYCKVLCDEVFGRTNFISNVIWQKKYSPQNDAKWLSNSHDHLLVYAKNKETWRPNQLPRTEEMNARYKNPDNDPRGPWKVGDLTSKTKAAGHSYPIKSPTGKVHYPTSGRQWAPALATFEKWLAENRIWFGESGNNVPSLKQFLSEVQDGTVAKTIWLRDEVGDNEEAKREVQSLNKTDVFETPKPERLIQRILQLATTTGDMVLDSFAGSGTTGAVAHKMRRRWIMVELGEHCFTHIIPRLKKVINGEDEGGVTNAVNWKGGGGYRFYELAPSLLKKDKWGNYIINPEYNAEMLAEAMCKHLGFTYAPSDSVFWQHGHSTETDFIYVTTQQLSRETLQKISDEVGEERTLLICCKAFRANEHDFPNITLQKIPKTILGRCEWDKDDYSSQIQNIPMKPEETGTQPALFGND